MSDVDPWAEIPASDEPGVDVLRRVDAAHPLEFWWGRDASNRCLLVLDFLTQKSKALFPDLSGIEILLFARDQSTSRMVLTLLDHHDRDIFFSLCSDLLRSTSGLQRGDNVAGVRIVRDRLARWRELFSKRRDRLSLQEIIGLVGELLLLRDFLLARLPAVSAMGMWRGPYGDEQDFVIGNTIVEVKTQLSTADHALIISSEHQLDTAASEVLVVHQLLGQAPPDAAASVSLNGLARELRTYLSGQSHEALDILEAGLLAVGYVTTPAYEEPVWLLVQRDAYSVADGFPRIVPSDLGPGIDRVRYHIHLEACIPFRTDAGIALGGLVNGQ